MTEAQLVLYDWMQVDPGLVAIVNRVPEGKSFTFQYTDRRAKVCEGKVPYREPRFVAAKLTLEGKMK